MAKKSDLTGPGLCRKCGDFKDRIAKGLCRKCYDELHSDFDPLAYAGRMQRERDNATKTLTNMICQLKKLKDCGVFDVTEHMFYREAFLKKRAAIEREQEIEFQRENEVAEQNSILAEAAKVATDLETVLDGVTASPTENQVEEEAKD